MGCVSRETPPLYHQDIAICRACFVQVTVIQQGVDVELDLLDPRGHRVLTVDSPNGEWGPERLYFIAPWGGSYRLAVRRLTAAAGGRFTMTIGVPHLPTAEERTRAVACRLESDRDVALAAQPPLDQIVNGYRRVIRLWRSVGDAAAEASAETKLGNALARRNKPIAAAAAWEEAHDLLSRRGLAGAQPVLCIRLGDAYRGSGKADRAAASYTEALQGARRLGDSHEAAEALTRMGRLERNSGAFWDAVVHVDEALSIAGAAGDAPGEGEALTAESEVYTVLGKLAEARAAAARAATLYRVANEPGGEAVALMDLGWACLLAGDAAAAHLELDSALELTQVAGDRREEAVMLDRLGMLARETGRPVEAVARHRQALEVFQAVDDREQEAFELSNLGLAQVLAGDPAGALRSEDQALPRLAEMRDSSAEAYALCRRARAERALGRLAAALQDVEQGLALLDDIRRRAQVGDLRMHYLDSVYDQYELLVDLLMEMHRLNRRGGFDRAALTAAERGRARVLLDLVALAPPAPALRRLLQLDESILALQPALGALSAPGTARQPEQALSAPSTARQPELALSAPSTARQPERAAAPPGLRQLQVERQRVCVEIERGEGGVPAAVSVGPLLDAGQIQRQLLEDDTVLLVYSLGEDRSFLWAVTRDRLESAELPPRAVLEKSALQLHDLLVRSRLHDDEVQVKLQADALSRQLLRPAMRLLGGRRIAVVPDGALAYLPFGVLPEPGGGGAPLLAGHEVVTLPSASVAAAIRARTDGRPRAPGRLAVLGDPLVRPPETGEHAAAGAETSLARRAVSAADARTAVGEAIERSLQDLGLPGLAPLPYAREEATTILALVPPAQRLGAIGAAASRALVLEGSLGRYAIVHFAAHALVDPSLPELSGIVLSMLDEKGRPQQGFLQSPDIAGLRLPAELVVLSACRTGLGKQLKGEGLVGLTQSFFQAGAARVVVSLWNVDDQATARLMEEFYRQLLSGGRPPAAALRAAQLALRRTKRWERPYYWAGFQLEGDWRALR